jgi:hypothetical protein
MKDKNIWDLFSYLTEFILPKLKAFKKRKRHSYPYIYTQKQWEKVLDKIIFSFEYTYIHEFKSIRKLGNFIEKNNLVNPYRKTKDNLSYCKEYQSDDGMTQMKFEKTKKPTRKNMIECRKHYYDIKAQRVIDKKVQEGFELFGKNFLSLWD